MRTTIIAANWKMNPPPQGWDAEDSPYRSQEGAEVLVFPAMPDIPACIETFLITGGQAGRPETTGAFTGDVSMQMLANHGCKYVLCGHSERRTHHAENDAFVAAQARAALEAGLVPLVCVGETADEREMGVAQQTVERQVKAMGKAAVIFAYEPVWAIGTGKTATPEDAQDMHAFIRSLLPAATREKTSILYGGSVKPDNAGALMAQPDIDGFLVGGASLEPASFRKIVDCCMKQA